MLKIKKLYLSFIFLFLFMVNSFGKIEMSYTNYYPLQIGNEWHFRETTHNHNDFPPISSENWSKKVVKDTTLENGHKYFAILETVYRNNSSIEWIYERIDSVKQQVYRYDPGSDSTGYEKLIIDFSLEKGDTIVSSGWSTTLDTGNVYYFDSTYKELTINKTHEGGLAGYSDSYLNGIGLYIEAFYGGELIIKSTLTKCKVNGRLYNYNMLDYYQMHIGDEWHFSEKSEKFIDHFSWTRNDWSLKIEKDTILSNGKKYQKWSTTHWSAAQNFYFERIDTATQKVYRYDAGNENEYLILDFLAEPGTTFGPENWLTTSLEEDSINYLDSILSIKGFYHLIGCCGYDEYFLENIGLYKYIENYIPLTSRSTLKWANIDGKEYEFNQRDSISWDFDNKSANFAFFIADYETYNFEGGYFAKFPKYTNEDSGKIPFSIIYNPPSDYGNIAFRYSGTNDTIFAADLWWAETGGITFPDSVENELKFRYDSTEVGNPQSVEYFNYVYEISDSLFIPKADSAWNTVKNLSVLKKFNKDGSNFRVGLYLFAPTVGSFDPELAKWIVFLYSNPVISGVEDQTTVNNKFELRQNYPNPFNPETTIKYSIPSSNKNVLVTLKIYDILGKRIKTLVNIEQSSGIYEVKFNGSGLASGVYLYKLEAGNFSDSKKFTLLK